MQRRYFMQDGKFISHTYQDAQPVVDRARTIRETHGNDGMGRFLGSIPNTLYYDWIAEAQRLGVWEPGQDGQLLNDFLAKKLRNDEFAALRGDW